MLGKSLVHHSGDYRGHAPQLQSFKHPRHVQKGSPGGEKLLEIRAKDWADDEPLKIKFSRFENFEKSAALKMDRILWIPYKRKPKWATQLTEIPMFGQVPHQCLRARGH